MSSPRLWRVDTCMSLSLSQSDLDYTVITSDLNQRIFSLCGYKPVASFTKYTVKPWAGCTCRDHSAKEGEELFT